MRRPQAETRSLSEAAVPSVTGIRVGLAFSLHLKEACWGLDTLLRSHIIALYSGCSILSWSTSHSLVENAETVCMQWSAAGHAAIYCSRQRSPQTAGCSRSSGQLRTDWCLLIGKEHMY